VIDRPKLARLALSLDVQRAGLHSLSDLYHASADHARWLGNQITGSPFADMTTAELAAIHVDAEDARFSTEHALRRDQLDVARKLAAERDRMRELSRQIDDARAAVEPLAALVTRLTQYATRGAA
jgi:hypothetical protein